MKRLLLLIILSLSFSSLFAQTIDEYEQRAKRVLEQYGEVSEEYLAAIDSIVNSASMANRLDIAVEYRKKHLAIVSRMKGENSNEVANDYARLSNSFYRRQDFDQALYFALKSVQICENNGYTQNETYQTSLGNVSDVYRKQGQYDLALDYQEKYARITEIIDGSSSDYYLWARVNEALLAMQVDKWEQGKLCCEIVLNSIKITDGNFFIYKYAELIMQDYLWRNNKHQEATDLIINFSKQIQNIKGENSVEYADCLGQIAKNYWLMDKIDLSVEYSLKAIEVYETYYADNKDGLYKDIGYHEECDRLALIYGIIGNTKEEYKYRKIVYDALKSSGQTGTKDYYDALDSLFSTASSLGDYQYALNLADEYETLIEEFSDNIPSDLLGFYGQMSMLLLNVNAEAAIKYTQKCISIIERHPSVVNEISMPLPYLLGVLNLQIAQLSIDATQYDIYFDKAQALIENVEDVGFRTQLHAQLVATKGQKIANNELAIELFNQAIDLYTTYKNILNNSLDPNLISGETTTAHTSILIINLLEAADNEISVVLTNRGLKYYQNGNSQHALDDFILASRIIEQNKSQNSWEYVMIQNNIAICEMAMGRYPDAIRTLHHNIDIAKTQFGDKSYMYAICLHNLCLYYHILGQFDKCYEMAKQCVEMYSEIEPSPTNDPHSHIGCLVSLSDCCIALNRNDEALFYAQEALKLIKKCKIEDVLLARVLAQLGSAYLRLGQYQNGLKSFIDAQNHLKNILGENYKYSFDLAIIHKVLAGHMIEHGLFEDARLEIHKTMFFLKNLELSHAPITTQVIFSYGLASIADNYTPEDYFYTSALNCLLHLYHNNLAFVTEKDREAMWEQVSAYKDIFFTASKDGDKSELLFDYILFSKSILLNTSTNFGKAIINSGDEELIEKYHQLLAMKDADNRRMQMNGLGVAPSQDIPRLEREILSKIEVDDYIASLECTHADISNVLKENEIAIEFVDYINLKTDKKHYVALVMRKGWDKPKYIDLFDGEELEALLEYSPQALYTSGEIGRKLYELVWKPLLADFKEGDTVYFSPAGNLYMVALEAINSHRGVPMSQLYNIIRLTSTREIFNLTERTTINSAVLYGGLKYDVDPETMASNSRQAENYDVASISFDRGTIQRDGWRFLPGSKKEVEHISQLFKGDNIEHIIYQDEYGNEESFKMLSGRGHSLLHLATHGFFMSNSEMQKTDYFKMDFFAADSTNVDPMYRSGLLLAGGNNVWKGNKPQEGVEDGIMTAAEISTMDLSSVDVVVLSACDTGLGDISGDGVFGLQRAFKQAGVNTIVMSLWRVDDAATELMMITFYENLIAGKPKREAFELAQSTLRNHQAYNNPYYWAAFVMLD